MCLAHPESLPGGALIDASFPTRYGIAVAATLIAAGARLALDPLWGVSLPLITFYPAIMASAWLGGLGPGLVTTVLSAAAANYFWLEPRFRLSPGAERDTVALVMFIVIGAFMSTAAEALHRARRRHAVALAQEHTIAATLAESQERLQVTIASIGDAVIVTDAHARITLMNGVAQSLTGWTDSAAMGQPLAEVFRIVDEDSRQPLDDPTQPALRDGKIAGLAHHTVLIAKDGREIPIDDSAAPIRDVHGRVIGAVLVFRDITEPRALERARTLALARERAARAEAERLAARLRQVQDITDTALAPRALDALLRDLLARTRVAMASETATVLLLADDGIHLRPTSSDGLREQLSEDIEIPVGHGIAGRIAVSDRGMIFDDLTGAEVLSAFLRDRVKSLVGAPLRIGDRMLGVIHVGAARPHRFTPDDLDLLRLVADRAAIAIERTRLDEAEQRTRIGIETAERRASFLAEVSQLLASSLDVDTTLQSLARLAVPEVCDLCVINLLDDDGTIRRPAAAYVDPTKQELIRELQQRFPIDPRGPHPVARVLRTHRGELEADITEAVLATIASAPDHLRIAREIGYRSYMVVPLVGRARTLGTISFVSGPSGRRYGASELALAEDIARRAALAIDNAMLYRRAESARADAEAANRTKDEFLAMLSHELRTPLTSMVGWLRMLRGGRLDDAKRDRALEVIERSVTVQTRLVDDLLDVARFTRGDVSLDLRPLALAPVIDAAVDAVRESVETKGLVVVREVDATVGPVVGDASRLQQVIGNLLANAIKFTPAGGRITVRLEGADGRARIAVSDTGQGIGASFLPHVFETFRQESCARQHSGLGLGLAIVRRLVELHDGTVRAESAGEGHGATFTVELPLARG